MYLLFLMLCLSSLDNVFITGAEVDCTPLLNAVKETRIAFMNFDAETVAIARSMVQLETGIDITDDAQLSRVVCEMTQAESLVDLAKTLNLPIGKMKSYYTQLVQVVGDKSFLPQLQTMLDRYEEALDFIKETGYPEFPLSLSEEEAMTALKVTGVSIYIFLESQDSALYAKALADSQTLQQFVEATGTEYKLEAIKQLPRTLREELDFYTSVSNLLRIAQDLGLFSLDVDEAPEISTPPKECLELLNLLAAIRKEASEIEIDIPEPLTVLLATDPTIVNEVICAIVKIRNANRRRLPSLEQVTSSVSVPPDAVQTLYRDGLKPLPRAIHQLGRQKRFVEAAMRFMDQTGYPNFPLSVSVQEAYRALSQTTGWAFMMILPGITRSGDTDFYAQALVQAGSVEEFAILTDTEDDLDLYTTIEGSITKQVAFYEHLFQFLNLGQRNFLFQLVEN